MNRYRNRKLAHTVMVASIIMLSGHAAAADLDLADNPLFVTAGVAPNIMFLIDDSGSMNNIVPDAPYNPSASQTCQSSFRINPANGQIDIRITSGGTRSFVQSGDPYNWGTANVSGGNPERCFNPTANYDARLYGEGSSDNTKQPGSYLPAQYTGHYLNWYFGSSPTSWGTDARAKRLPVPASPPYQYALRRMDIAKTAAKSMVAGLLDVRVGLASYNGDTGGEINASVADLTAAQRTKLNNRIDALQPTGSTPLAESLHDIGRYFVGQSAPQYDGMLTLHPDSASPIQKDDDAVFNHSPIYGSEPNHSPIQQFCQKNFALLLTDGRPQSDQSIATSTGLTDYKGECAASGDCLTFGRKPPPREYESAGSDYLDDIAAALYDIDLRPDLDDEDGNEVKNNVVTYTIGFADDQVINDPLMQATADSGGGLFLQARNASQLTNALRNATSNIFRKVEGSASSVSFNTGSIRAGSQLYQAKFKTAVWTGQVLALSLHDGVTGVDGCNDDDPIGALCPIPQWDAGCTLTGGLCDTTGADLGSPNGGAARTILTYKTGTIPAGVPFALTELTASQQAQLNKDATGATDTRGSARVNYLRGDRTQEQTSGGVFRDRESLLGDIVHSSPAYVGPPLRRYPVAWYDQLGGVTPENAGGAQTYRQFKAAHQTRTTMVYAGANDGFLHGFESGKYNTSRELVSGNEGVELLAYMPSKVLQNARYLTYPDYTHRYSVDGAPVENDVFFDGGWRTVLVGGLGAGGQGLYALDISDPDSFSENYAASTVLWEFNDNTATADPSKSSSDLGFTVSQPAIVRLHNGRWGAVVANGYNNTKADGAPSATGNAVLYVLDIKDGSVLAKLDTGVGKAQDPTTTDAAQKRPNGLASPFPVDKDGDFVTDYVYAGDLFGNVWRFDLTATNPNDWKVSEFANSGVPTPLFTARDGSNRPQPITTQVQVGVHSNGLNRGVMVYFGTGKALQNSDETANTSTTQTFYGIWDKDFFGVGASIDVDSNLSASTKSGFTRANLQQQQIDAEQTASGDVFRRVTNNPVDYASTHGWYLDLKLVGGSNTGEMVTVDPVVRGKAVIFTTLIPQSGPCVARAAGFLMVVDQATGGRTRETPFDRNGDRQFTPEGDYLNFGGGSGGSEAASGIDITGSTAGFVLAGDIDHALIPQFNGRIAEQDLSLGAEPEGRKTWRQLR